MARQVTTRTGRCMDVCMIHEMAVRRITCRLTIHRSACLAADGEPVPPVGAAAAVTAPFLWYVWSHAVPPFLTHDLQESMNMSREALPLPTLQPIPAFPKLSFPALPITENSEQDMLLEIKRDLLSAFHSSRFAEDMSQKRRPIVRYSDRYSMPVSQGTGNQWDYRLFPSELHYTGTKAKKTTKKKKKVAVAGALAQLPADDAEEESSDESEDEAGEVAMEEDLGEEETDYALTYFDNGEEYLEAENEDNGDEGPTY